MSGEVSSALIVDDETASCQLLAGELTRRGITCDVTDDGIEASRLLDTKPYHVVVTDLRTANRQGYPFIMELLQRKRHPPIVVYTGALEPRLANELKARGVDEIYLKPLDCDLMSARIGSLLERRGWHSPTGAEPAAERKTVPRTTASGEELLAPVGMSQLNAKLSEISRVMPISNAALDVYNMTRTDQWDMSGLAAAAQRDAALTTEILRRANSAHYNTSGRQISDLQEAVMRIGQRRVGELALATSAMSMLMPTMLPWIDRDLDWKRSLAAGLAMESLIDQGRHMPIEDGLILSAVMQSMGQIVLGTLFPKHYEVMLKRCEKTGETLQELERFFFPTTNTEIMAQVLASWRIPADVYLPLKFSLHDWANLAELEEPTRTKAELVKLAVTLGRLSIDRWKSWDLVELPAPSVLRRLKINNVRTVVQSTRSDVNALAHFGRSERLAKPTSKLSDASIQLDYTTTQHEALDAFAELLPALGVEARPCTMCEIRNSNAPVIINCLDEMSCGTSHAEMAPRAIIFAANAQGPSDETIALPQSYGKLREAFQHRLSEAVKGPVAGAALGVK